MWLSNEQPVTLEHTSDVSIKLESQTYPKKKTCEPSTVHQSLNVQAAHHLAPSFIKHQNMGVCGM